MPVQLDRRRTEATHDTTPNRFVKFALGALAAGIGRYRRGPRRESQDPAVARGLREVAQVMGQLDEVLHQDLFRELGPLDALSGRRPGATAARGLSRRLPCICGI